MGSEEMGHVAFLAGLKEYHGHLKETILCNARSRLFEESDESAFSSHFSKAKSRLSDEHPALGELLDLRLATEALLFADKIPAWALPWFGSHTTISTWLGFDLALAVLHGRWAAVPVLLVGNSQVYIRYFIAGMSTEALGTSPWPSWAEPLMDPDAKTAIETAMFVAQDSCPEARGRQFFCYPLVLPAPMIQIQGGSLALPLALGFRGLLSDNHPNQRLAATGALERDGRVRRVGFVGQKLALAGTQFFGLILPKDNVPNTGIPHTETLPVSDFEQAAMFWDLYAPGQADLLVIFSMMLVDPSRFVSNCHTVPPAWLRWAKENQKTDGLLKALRESPGLFVRLSKRFEACADRFRVKQAKAIGSLVLPEILAELQVRAPLAAFRWHIWNLGLSNHRGGVADAEVSVRQAIPLVRVAMAADLESVAVFFTHVLVSLHNRYDFKPDLPLEVAEVLACLEGLYEKRCACGCRTYPALGRLYGTLAQHYGFCGPQYLEKTELYARKAALALGEDTIPEYKDEWLRQRNYLTYAYLDAGRWERAEACLFTYLGMTDWSGLDRMYDRLSAWKHALLARFLADNRHPEHAMAYLEHADRVKDTLVKDRHPWQLWLWNLGRIALEHDKEPQADILFRRSLEQCRSSAAGPTIQMMALLPLSGLWRLGTLTKGHIDDIKPLLRHATTQLADDYFRAIKDQPFERVLSAVWDAPAKLFPFTYR
ncbi:MAG: hypothetical protein JRI36_10700 [Deltaproteobacteria bacterium]|nr:hypothetical protein [Deltaproteobacteria bacterium]